jgi:hypothetical protein
MHFGFKETLLQIKRIIMGVGIVLSFCLVILSISLPMLMLSKLNGVSRDATIPAFDTYSGIEALNNMRYRDNEGWKNPLIGHNNTWIRDPAYVLNIHHCLSRALVSNEPGPFSRLSLCYLPQSDGDKKIIDVREFQQESDTGNLHAGIRGIRLNRSQFKSLLEQAEWVNEWFDRRDVSLQQMLNSSSQLPAELSQTPEWIDPIHA